ncbi:MAG: hypothetical protein KDI65_01455 [Alphaproteobacteria bacterium]|nr:hypothetical protein [Alphaproteobacteria bacterium]
MNPFLSSSFFLFFCLCLLLCGCGEESQEGPELLPLPSTEADPGDDVLMASIHGFLKEQTAPAQTRYEYARFDLNDDGKRDALVYLKSPYGYWCGMEGCALLVMKAEHGQFVPINLIRPVRNPVYVGAGIHSGWHDLAVRVAGGEEKAGESILYFDGKKYPSYPPLPITESFLPDQAVRTFFP